MVNTHRVLYKMLWKQRRDSTDPSSILLQQTSAFLSHREMHFSISVGISNAVTLTTLYLSNLYRSEQVNLDLHLKARWETHHRGYIPKRDVAPVT